MEFIGFFIVIWCFLVERRDTSVNEVPYFGRYTHRIAISNNRILAMGEDAVTIGVKDYKNN